MEPTFVEIVTLISSIILGIIVAFVTKTKNDDGSKKIEWGLALSSTLIAALIGSHLQTRIEASKINSLLVHYQQFSDNPNAVKMAQKELAVSISLPENNKFFRDIYSTKSKRYKNNLDFLCTSKIEYNITDLAELGEMQSDAIRIFETATKDTKIRATSYVNVDQWWNNEFGEEYSNANKKASERGVEIQRVWILKSRDELNDPSLKKTLQTEKKWNIKSYYVLEKDIQDFDETKIDIIIVTTKKNASPAFYGELNLTLWRKMTSVTFASNTQRLNELNSYWDDLMNIAEEY